MYLIILISTTLIFLSLHNVVSTEQKECYFQYKLKIAISKTQYKFYLDHFFHSRRYDDVIVRVEANLIHYWPVPMKHHMSLIHITPCKSSQEQCQHLYSYHNSPCFDMNLKIHHNLMVLRFIPEHLIIKVPHYTQIYTF